MFRRDNRSLIWLSSDEVRRDYSLDSETWVKKLASILTRTVFWSRCFRAVKCTPQSQVYPEQTIETPPELGLTLSSRYGRRPITTHTFSPELLKIAPKLQNLIQVPTPVKDWKPDSAFRSCRLDARMLLEMLVSNGIFHLEVRSEVNDWMECTLSSLQVGSLAWNRPKSSAWFCHLILACYFLALGSIRPIIRAKFHWCLCSESRKGPIKSKITGLLINGMWAKRNTKSQIIPYKQTKSMNTVHGSKLK